MPTLHVEVPEARALVTASNNGDTTFVEVGLRVPGQKHTVKRSSSVREVTSPLWGDALFDFDIDQGGAEGEIEIRVFQGGAPDDTVVGETVIDLRKLPDGGFERKPIRLDRRKGIVRVTASLKQDQTRTTSGDRRKSGRRQSDGPRLEEGMKVDAMYRGGRKSYAGTITIVNKDGTCDIDYDDGDREASVKPNLITPRASPSRSPRRMNRKADLDMPRASGSREGLEEGTRVEARYKGRSRYYPGTVHRVLGDGSCDVHYDDGEKERMVDPSLIKVLNSFDQRGRPQRQGDLRSSLEEGMRVEARYRGRPRYFPGRIARVARDGSCDIDYDNGEKESMVRPSFIKTLASDHSREKNFEDGLLHSDGNVKKSEEQALGEGARVEARYKGRIRYYPGRVSKVHRDGSCDIAYDNGETEKMVEPSLVKVVSRPLPGSAGDKRNERLQEGMKVEARYKGRSRFYPGTISRLRRNGTFDIDYDDGEKEQMVEASLIKSVERGESSEVEPREGRLQEGMKVDARYKGRTRYYAGKISRIHPGGSCDIDYNDGEKERMVEPSLIKGVEEKKREAFSIADGSLREGMKVEARYRGRSRYYPGRISRVYRDGKCDIDYDDGEQERMVESILVRVLEKEINDGSGTTPSSLKEGMKVEARYRGRSRYYPGRISRVYRDGRCDINYDDGEREHMVEPSLVRAVEKEVNEGSNTARSDLKTGVAVEARYKGRSRYYSGRISRVHRDGTCDIDYDDGEQEHAVEPHLIRVVERDKNEGSGNAHTNLREGMKVEARYRGRSRFYPGRISRVHRDGTCDIDYDDGELERMVVPSLIKPVELRPASPKRSARIDPDNGERKHEPLSPHIQEGARVEARYKGRSRSYPGKVSRVHRDGSCDIHYDDGEEERMVEPSLIRVLKSPRSRGPSGNTDTSADPLTIGQCVEARYRGRSRFSPGKILLVHPDGTCDIEYDDGEKERKVKRSLIKTRRSPKDSSSDVASSGKEFKEGSRVEARYKGRSRYHPGTVKRVRFDGSIDVDYDDGEREHAVKPSLVRRLDSFDSKHKRQRAAGRYRSSSKDRDGSDSEGLKEGMQVEARYMGKSRYYRGKITRVHRDGLCDIHYEDGEKENMVDPSLIRKAEYSRPSRLSRRHSNEIILEGDEVEANYRGNGKYQPGKVVRVRPDGTFDINYEDGDKETRVAADAVRLVADDDGSNRKSNHRDRSWRFGSSPDVEESSPRRPARSRSRGRDRDGASSVQRGQSPGRRFVLSSKGGGDVERRPSDQKYRSSSSASGSESGDSRGLGGKGNKGRSQESKRWQSVPDAGSAKQRRRPRIDDNGSHTSSDGGSDFVQGSRVEACWHRASPYSRPRRTSNWEDGRVLASHGDGTFTIKYSSSRTEEDVPKACIRAAIKARLGSRNRRPPPRGDAKRAPQSTSGAGGKLATHSVWRAVESMVNELGKKSGAGRSKRASLRSLEGERDESKKIGLLMGTSESARFRRAFDRADLVKSGELTAVEAAHAYRDLGGRTTEAEVGDFLRISEGAGKSARLDFPTFVKTYAWIFFRRGQNGADYSDDDDSSSDSGVSLIEGYPRRSAENAQGRGSHLQSQENHPEGQNSAQRIGYGSRSSWYRTGKAGRRRSRMEHQRVDMGIGEEAELRRWEKRLGEAQMRRLKQAFGSWADDASVLEVRDLGACFRELGKNADKRELRAWCEEVDLAPEDVLSLADCAYAFHAMFGDVEEGTPEQHDALIRRLSVGRSSQQASMLTRARDIFEELDEDRDGEIPRKLVAKLLARVGRDPKTCTDQIATFCNGIASPARDGRFDVNTSQKARGKRGRRNSRRGRARDADEIPTGERAAVPSTTSLAEIFTSFGFVFESAGRAVKPSVAEAFAMLRLHAQPAEARSAGEAARRYIENILSAPGDARFWRVNSNNDAFFTKLGRYKGGRELLAAVGFCDELRVEAGRRDSDERAAKSVAESVGDSFAQVERGTREESSFASNRAEREGWLVLEGTVGHDGKPVAAVGEAQLKVLRATRDEVDAELLALDGAPSVSAALRALRESSGSDLPAPVGDVRAAAEILLAYVVNALRNPRDPRVHRVHAGNPVFQRALGRLGGCEGAMKAVGFEPQDRGTIFVLRVGSGSTVKGEKEVGTANFRFPALDPIMEAFLWRRKADLEAAIEVMPSTTIIASAEAPQGARGRATADLNDARTLAGDDFNRGVEVEDLRVKRCATASELAARGLNRTENEKRDKVGIARSGMPRSSRGRFQGNRTTGVGAATSRALSVTSGGSKAIAGARDLQLAMIKESFTTLDIDGDGFISPDDLRSAFRNMGRDASDRSVYAWIRRRNIRQDGRVSLDEFVASFQALMPPDTAGWATAAAIAGPRSVKKTSRAKATRGVSETDDAKGIANDDGASDVAAAFGRIRLSGSPPECRAAAEYVLDYCRRVRDSPSAPLHWRIPLASKRFASAVGKLSGGIELMQSVGLRLEENGTVLALREDGCASGAKWNCVPEDVLKRLDSAAKELTAQMRGIDHPEVADLAAVSAAVARLRNAAGNAGPHLRCIEAAAKCLGNVLEHPSTGKYRRINTSNPIFLRDVVSVQGGMQLMVALGFREDVDGQLLLPMDTNLAHLAARKLELDSGLPFLRAAAAANERETKAPEAGSASKIQPTPGSVVEGEQGRKASAISRTSFQRGTTRAKKSRLLPCSSQSGDAQNDSKSLARGKSESPERSAAAEARRMHQGLKTEARSGQETKATLLKHKKEIDKLQREIAAYKEKEASTLPVRDALTIARMDEQERASVARLASKMGMDITNATEALIWAESVNKRPTPTAPGEVIPAERLGRAAASARGRGRPGLRKRSMDLVATELLAAAAAGHALLEVARPEIFRVGCKVVLGSGGGQEGRFVTAVVGPAEAEDGRTEGYGGMIVLETSIARDHPEGARVIPARPGRAEAESYRKRRVVSMVLDSLLRPIIETAARLGERVLSARATQSAFERRAVPKYAFTVAPACVGRTRAIPEDGDDGYTNRGIAVLPELGKVVSVAGKSTLVCHQETLSLIYLRRSFLAIGRSASRGKITAQEFRSELQSNPILAAGLSCTCGEQVTGGDPGDRALREIHRRRRCNALGGVQLRDDGAKEAGRQVETESLETITWPEFVGAFLPLKPWEEGERAARHRNKTKDEPEQCSLADDCGWDNGLLPDADDEEMELLQVAFAVRASGVQGRNGGGTATLTELRAASVELDGVVPPEEPIRKALRPDTSGNGWQTSNEARGGDSYSFRDFVLLRAILARDAVPGGGGGAGFAAGWRLSALMHLRRVFLKVFDANFVSAAHAELEYNTSRAVDGGHNNLDFRCPSPPVDSAVELNAKSFVSEALKEPAVVRFLGMRTGGPWRRQVTSSEGLNCTLRAAIHGLATSSPAGTDTATTVTRNRAGMALAAARKQEGDRNTVRWEDVEGLLFEPFDPAVVMSGLPLTTSAGLRSLSPAGRAEEAVVELATEAEAGFIYVLMADGEVKVYDAAGPIGGSGVRLPSCGYGGPLWRCQLITHEPSPRALGSEGWRESMRWREAVGLDKPLMSNTTDGRSGAENSAQHQCKDGARRLLRLRPRARILHPCTGTGLLLINSTAGDRCVRFHETHALRRICRTRLDLPPPPRSSLTGGQGLFDALAVSGAGLGKVASSSRDEGAVAPRDRDEIGTTESSLVDLAFLPVSSTLIGLIGGRAEVQAFCSDTGLVLAIFAGHALVVNCMLWVPSQLMLVTGSADSTARVWDIGEDFVPHADEWAVIKHSVINHSGGDATQCDRYDGAANISALEDAVITSGTGENTLPPVEGEHRPVVNKSTAEEAPKEQLLNVIRSLRPELLRQARARPMWRTARVTAVLDRTRSGLNLAPAPGATRTGPKASGHHPLIEVTYDDGEVQVGVEPYRLRSLEEMQRRADGDDEQATGPDWERQAVHPAVGVEVAVFGYSEREVYELVADMIKGGAKRESWNAIGVLNPAPFSQAGILASLKELRERAALAAAGGGDKSSGDNLSSPITLDAALDAAEVTDNGLCKLSGALATVWKSAFCRLHSPSAAAAERRSRIAWSEVARALVRPQWSGPAMSGARDEMTAGRDGRKSKFQLCQWRKLRLLVPCKFRLSYDGGSNDGVTQVTSLEYLPLAMLLATGHSDGRVRLWDPRARKHRLAPPPLHYGGKRFTSSYQDEPEGGIGGRGGNTAQLHGRIWPGFYTNAAEEWTKTGRTFGLVAEFDAATSATARKAQSEGRTDPSSGPSGSVRVSALSAVVIPGGGGGPSLIVCDMDGARAARALDEEEPPWNMASSGDGGGVFYLMCTGEVLALPCPQGFEEGYVLLDDASFFEVYAPLGTQDHAEAALFRKVFRARSRVLRVIYAASVGRPAIEAIARRMNESGVAARTRQELATHFSGRRFAVFYRDGDGSEGDIMQQIYPASTKDVASIAFGGGGSSSVRIDDAHCLPLGDHCSKFASGAVTSADSTSLVGSVEFLRVETGGSGPRTKSATSTPMLSAWVVGRVSVRVEARSFDEELGEDRQVAAEDAFMGAWALRMQYLRALCSARTEAARDRASAEARVMARMGEGLRLCSLDRAGGEREETSVGTRALVQAVATALRLPSRFPSASAHHRRGTYFQAAKVMRSLVLAEDKLRERDLRASCQARDLVDLLKRSANSPFDHLARHFLGAALTPALEDVIAEIPNTGGHRAAERPIRWSCLRTALDAAIDVDKVTTEEAFVLLVRFGQLPAGGEEFEKFAKRARELVSSSSNRLHHNIVNPSATGTGADGEPLRAIPYEANDKVRGSSASAREKNDQEGKRWGDASASDEGIHNEVSSVLLRPSDVADLAAVLDPLGKVECALAALKKTFRAGLSSSGRRFGLRSPLQSYAATRRFLVWRKRLVATGDGLRVAKLKVGRRCQDLLLADSGHASTIPPFGIGITPAVTAAELVAEANGLMATVARRKTAASGGGDKHFRKILMARVNSHAPLPDRSTKGVRCFDGWGYYEHAAGLGGRNGKLRFKKGVANGASDDAGEPVAVLEISSEQAREIVNAFEGGTTSFGDNMVFTVSLLSVPALCEHPGLIKFYPGVRVVPGENVTSSSGDGDRAAGGSSVHVVCERLQGWRSLREVVRQHGPLISLTGEATGENEGLRVLRMFGKQLIAVLECLGSRSLVLRDLRASTVFVSPDGRNLKVVAFSSLATLEETGTVSPGAPALDPEVHGPTQPLTPPEGLTTSTRAVSSSCCGGNNGDDVSVVLTNGERPGAFLATAAWDVWTLGILLYELAFGDPPPSYGVALNHAVTSSGNVAEAEGLPVPRLEDLALTVQYDFLSSVVERVARARRQGSKGGSSNALEPVPALVFALRSMSLGAALGVRSPNRRSTVELRSRASLGGQENETGQGERIVESFRRAWINRQLHMEERGDVDVSTWQEFQDKIKRHLDVSIASAPPLPGLSSFSPAVGVAGRRIPLGNTEVCGTAADQKVTTMAVNRTMARLREKYAGGNGWLPFHVVQRVLLDDLQLSLSKSEAEILAACLKEGAPYAGTRNSTKTGLDLTEDEVFYSPLEHILRASVSTLGEAQASRPCASSSPPTIASFVEVLCVCLEPDPRRRPSPSDLLRLPFFSSGERNSRDEEEIDRAAAASYLAGSGTGESSSLILRECVLRPVQAIEDALLGLPEHYTSRNCTSVGSGCPLRGKRTSDSELPAPFDVGALMGALKEIQRLVRGGSRDFQGEDPSRVRKAALDHARVMSEIFESGVLMKVSAIGLRFLEQEEAEKTGRGVAGTGFVEGDPHKTIGTRILLALARVLEEFLAALRRADSPILPHTEVVLRCLVSLFLGEEGCIAVKYGRIGPSPLRVGPIDHFPAISTISCETELSHWRPAVSQIFEGVLVEAVGETGEGGSAYPVVQRYLRRCAQKAYSFKPSAIGGNVADEDSDDDSRGGSDGNDDDNNYDCGDGGDHYRRENPVVYDDGEDWASSSEEEDNRPPFINGNEKPPHQSSNGMPRVCRQDRDLVSSQRLHRFIRAPLYFSELLVLMRILCTLHRSPRTIGGSGSIGAPDRSRRKASTYCLAVVRMCCEMGTGGLDHAEPAGWVGGRDIDEDTATLQRTQLLVDIRLAEKLAPCLHDPDFNIRNNAVRCALSALRSNHTRLRWISLSDQVRGSGDPRAILALGFCTAVWVSGFGAMIRDRSVPFRSSGNTSRAERESEESSRIVALHCLRYMATAGGLLFTAGAELASYPFSKGLSAVVAPEKKITAESDNVARNASGGTRSSSLEFNGWAEGVLEVMRTLAENGSMETHSLLQSQPTLIQGLKGYGLLSTEALTPKGVATKSIELLAGGTLEELIYVIRQAHSILATAVAVDDRGVLGSNDNVPRDVGVFISLIWGWMQRALVQLLRDESDHPSTAARVSLVWECLELMRFLLSSASTAACRLARIDVHLDVAVGDVSCTSGLSSAANIAGHGGSDAYIHKGVCGPMKLQLGTARTGLEVVALLLSMEEPIPLNLYRAHPISLLTVGAADSLGDALTCGDPGTIDYLESYGLGLRLGLAVEASARHIRESRRLGVEDIHLLCTYPAGRRARVKLLDRVLYMSHRGLQEQVIASGLVEFVVSNMLPDCETTEVVDIRLPASFVRHNGTPLVRNEGLALMERVLARRRRSPAVAREMARQAVRHTLPAAEYGRLRRFCLRSVRVGVGVCLRCLARLDNASVDNALIIAGVPHGAIFSTRKNYVASKTRRRWARWLRRGASRASLASTVNELPARGKCNIPTSSVCDKKRRRDLTHAVDDYQGVGSSDSKYAANSAPWASHDCERSARIEQSPEDTVKEKPDRSAGSTRQGLPSRITAPQSAVFGSSDLGSANALKTATREKRRWASLTIEGKLPNLSISDVLELLATDLGATSDVINVVEVDESFSAVERATVPLPLFNDPAAATTVSTTSHDFTLEVSLPETLANRLYTRCLAGVLRVPGLLFLKVEGKGKLTWNGQEIFSEDRSLSSGATILPDSEPRMAPDRAAPFVPTANEPGRISAPVQEQKMEASGAASILTSKRPRPSVSFSSLAPSAANGKNTDDLSTPRSVPDKHSRIDHPVLRGWQSIPSQGGMVLNTHPKEALDLGGKMVGCSENDKRGRIATALDRVGAGVVEVRDAFRRRLPLQWQAADKAEQGPSDARSTSTLGRQGTRQRTNEESRSGATSPEKKSDENVVKEAMVLAMTDLRLPKDIARKHCSGVWLTSATAGVPSFSDFIERYATGAGLFKDPIDGKQAKLWVEGPGGIWVAVSPEEMASARAAFDEQIIHQGGDTKSEEVVELGLEGSLDKSGAVLALRSIFPNTVSTEAMEKLLKERCYVIDGFFGGRVSFQEFVRAVLHLAPAMRFDANTTPPPWTSRHQSVPSDTCDTDTDLPHSPRSYFDGMPGRVLGGGKSTAQDSALCLPKESHSTSPITVEQDRRHNLSTQGARAQDTGWSSRGPATASVSQRLDRDFMEERRKWAHALEAGRMPTVHSREISEQNAAAADAYSLDAGSRKGIREGWRSDAHNKRPRLGRPRSADHATPAFGERRGRSTSVEDPVSRAFEMYAMDCERDRERDRERGQLKHPPPLSTRASENETSARLSSYSGPPRVGPREPPPVSSPKWTNRHEYGGASELQSPGRQHTGLPCSPRPPSPSVGEARFGSILGGARTYSSVDEDSGESLRRRRYGGSRSRDDSSGFNQSGERSRSFGSPLTFDIDGRVEEGAEGKDLREMVSDSKRQRALRRAFDAYDLNGDGFITYLELKAVFEQRGVDASDAEVRSWIDERDRSGTGAVDFEDFSRAFVFLSP